MTMSTVNQTARPEPVALFVSDLHLQTEMPSTTAAFLAFLKRPAREAKQLFLLGDIFEYWAGDDDLASPFAQKIAQALRAVSDAGVELFWMAGNRDFLVNAEFARATRATLLSDPYILTFANQRYLLTHGDQLCTDDVEYQQFRAMVRQPDWQSKFLALPLNERKNIIANMRMQSQQHQAQQTPTIMDVNQGTADQFFKDYQAQIMIHGHTHRPATHHVLNTFRYVLSDWDNDHAKPRGDWLALFTNGSMQRYDFQGVAIKT
jgi:UDP-2,3-diacylglucosamine hydrolase